jgi:hypothetical protein
VISTLHERLEAEGPRVAPEPETAEELLSRPKRSSRLIGLLATLGAVAGTLLLLDQFGILEFPEQLVLIAFTATFLLEIVLTLFVHRNDEVGDDD